MKSTIKILVLVAMVVGTFGCAGKQFVNKTELGNVTVIQGGRTGVFGTDNSFVHIQKRTDQAEAVLRLEKTYERSFSSWEGCPEKTPNKRARNIHREEETKKESQDVPNPATASSEQFGFGYNPSTGNVLLPAAAEAAGIAASGVFGGGGDIVNKAFGGNAEANSSSESNANAEINDSGNSNSGGHGRGRDHGNRGGHDGGGGCNKKH